MRVLRDYGLVRSAFKPQMWTKRRSSTGTVTRQTLFKSFSAATAQPWEVIDDIRGRGVLLDLALVETRPDTVTAATPRRA